MFTVSTWRCNCPLLVGGASGFSMSSMTSRSRSLAGPSGHQSAVICCPDCSVGSERREASQEESTVTAGPKEPARRCFSGPGRDFICGESTTTAPGPMVNRRRRCALTVVRGRRNVTKSRQASGGNWGKLPTCIDFQLAESPMRVVNSAYHVGSLELYVGAHKNIDRNESALGRRERT